MRRSDLGTNVIRDLFAGMREVVGGRSSACENELRKEREVALQEIEQEARRLGSDAVVAIDPDDETVGRNGSPWVVTIGGTAVNL